MQKKPAKRKIHSYIRGIVWVVLVQFILLNISAALYAYHLTHVYDAVSSQNNSSKNIFTKTWRLFTGPRQSRSFITGYPSFPFDTIQLKTKSGLAIEAWYSKTDSLAHGTVLLFHGITMNKGRMLSEASEFRFLGYNVLLIDFRAHGNSEGNTTTLGVRETEEVKLAYDYIHSLGEKNIYLWGSSMGAVVVAKAIADYQLLPSGVILEMPFESLQTHLRARAKLLGFQGFPEKPFGFLVSGWMGWQNSFNGWKHSTTHYVTKINCPLLMQYGALDNFVLKSETDNVFANVTSANKKLIIYENAGHESLQQNDPVKWKLEIKKFLDSNLR